MDCLEVGCTTQKGQIVHFLSFALPWLMREMERLQPALSAESAAPALADGGVPAADIAQSYPEADWDAVCGEMSPEPWPT